MRTLSEEIEYCSREGFLRNTIELSEMLAWYGEQAMLRSQLTAANERAAELERERDKLFNRLKDEQGLVDRWIAATGFRDPTTFTARVGAAIDRIVTLERQLAELKRQRETPGQSLLSVQLSESQHLGLQIVMQLREAERDRDDAKRQLAEAGKAWHGDPDAIDPDSRSGWFMFGLRGVAIAALDKLPKPETP